MYFGLTTSRIVTIPRSAAFRGGALIKGAALFRGRRVFQCGYPKLRRLFEARRLLEEIRYLSLHKLLLSEGVEIMIYMDLKRFCCM